MRVLEEAQRVSAGEAAGSSVPAPEAGADAAAAGPPAASSSAAAAAGPAVGQCSERRGKQGQAKASALTSLDIHKASFCQLHDGTGGLACARRLDGCFTLAPPTRPATVLCSLCVCRP